MPYRYSLITGLIGTRLTVSAQYVRIYAFRYSFLAAVAASVAHVCSMCYLDRDIDKD
jgi:hypothetical protein